jgi:hypothetical protein
MRKLNAIARFLTGSCLGLFFFVGGASATTYYVDYLGGADTNDGTGKATPWQHAPGMNGCSGVCARSATIGLKPGDNIILKGGVTWPNGALAWIISWSGTANSPIYVGVDQSWYSGVSWARPILDGGRRPITGNGNNNDFIMASANYIRIDNIEFTGLYWDATYTKYGQNLYIAHHGFHDAYITNNYFHGWSHAPGVHNDQTCIQGNTDGSDPGSYVAYNVFDGSDTDGVSGSAIYGSPFAFYGNYCGHMANCFVAGFTFVHDNLIEYLQPMFDGGHSNGMESLGDVPIRNWNSSYAGNAIGALVYNNVIRHIPPGIVVLDVEANNGSDISYVFNNVIYDTGNGNVLDIAASRLANQSSPFGSIFVANNTVECGPDRNPNITCSVNVNRPLSTSHFVNNHYITSDSTPNGGSALGKNTYVLQTKAAANRQGNSSSQAYAFSPTSAKGSTVGRGTSNLTSLCTSNALLTPLCQDTTYAVSYNRTNHTVISPARVVNARPTTGSWDAGAYQYKASGP